MIIEETLTKKENYGETVFCLGYVDNVWTLLLHEWVEKGTIFRGKDDLSFISSGLATKHTRSLC